MKIDQKYSVFLAEIKQQIYASRNQAIRSINKKLITLYWDLGKLIVTRQKELGWGKSVVEKLSRDLQEEFPNMTGFSSRNLWDMKRFYETYNQIEKLRQPVAEVPWGHHLVILNKVSDAAAQEYYIKASAKLGWSRNVLLNQVKAQAYERHVLNKKHHNFEKALPVHLAEQASESIKSIYNLDFLGIGKPVLEKELEGRLVEKIKKFILELGYGFSFIGNQFKISLKENEYFIDLLFFNRTLKCLVAIELKTGNFEPEHAGKMDFYLHILDDTVKLSDENPSIGIILCASKKDIVVEYALRSSKKPIGVAEYQLTKILPKQFQGKLPNVNDFKKQIEEEFFVSHEIRSDNEAIVKKLKK